MNSMTGYGKGTAEIESKVLTVDMKSVNNRFLEINSRMPKAFCAFDDALRKLIGGKIRRGAVDVYFSYEDKSKSRRALKTDTALAAAYADEGRRLAKELKIKNNVDAAYILRQDGVISFEAQQDDGETVKSLMLAAAGRALEALSGMREKEGAALYDELEALGASLSEITGSIAALSETVLQEQRERIRARMSEILKETMLDENKILAEAAFYADRSDITEEIARLRSHLKQYAKLLTDNEAGKKLDFLTQELNREVNTIGSKTGNVKITELVTEAKAVVEKIKEQSRNVE